MNSFDPEITVRICAFLGDTALLVWFFSGFRSRGIKRELPALLFLVPLGLFYDLFIPSFSAVESAFIRNLGEPVFLFARSAIRWVLIALYLYFSKYVSFKEAALLALFYELLYVSCNIRSGLFKQRGLSVGTKHLINLGNLGLELLFGLVVRKRLKLEGFFKRPKFVIIVSLAGIAWLAFFKPILININDLPDTKTVITPLQRAGIVVVSLVSMVVFLSLFILVEVNQQMLEEKYRKENEEQIMLREMQGMRRTLQTSGDIQKIYHDMKNHFIILRSMADDGTNEDEKQYLDQLLGQIEGFERQVATGNRTVDAILSEKIHLGSLHGIHFNLYLDLKCLDFMQPVDIVTIWGNALDNAVEATEKIPDPEKRIIYIKSEMFAQNLIIRFSNPVAEPVEISKGRPATTKSDKEHHGIGLGSLERAASRYSGGVNLSMDEDAGMFTLTVLIPVPE